MVTILTTVPDRRSGSRAVLTKTYTMTDSGWQRRDYDNALLFDAIEYDLRSIDELSALLFILEEASHCCIVRAKPIGATENIRRKLAGDPTAPATLMNNPEGLSWVMLDMDKLPVSDLDLVDIDQRLNYLISLLPDEFRHATYHYQWSSSAGMDGWETLSCHLWFFLDQPWFCRDLYERFATGDFRDVEVDESVFTSNQIHYTAAPIFNGGVDPLAGERSGLVRGAHDVVALRPIVRPIEPTPAISPQRHYDLFGLTRFEELLAEIGPHYHKPILRAAAHYCAVVSPEAFDRNDLEQRLRNAIISAPPGRNRMSNYLNYRYLGRVIDGAIRKYGRDI